MVEEQNGLGSWSLRILRELVTLFLSVCVAIGILYWFSGSSFFESMIDTKIRNKMMSHVYAIQFNAVDKVVHNLDSIFEQYQQLRQLYGSNVRLMTEITQEENVTSGMYRWRIQIVADTPKKERLLDTAVVAGTGH